MNTEQKVATMQLQPGLPKGVALLATANFRGGEKDPTVDVAVYRNDFPAGESDSRLNGQNTFRNLCVRQFFPTSGCAVMIENGVIVFAEPGLQGFIGKQARIIHRPSDTEIDVLLIVWEAAPIDLDNEELLLPRLTSMLYGLTLAFA